MLLLIAGGLSLGVAMQDTGLTDWLVSLVPLDAFGFASMALALAYLTALLSNLMSNTAAANILVPIALVAAAGNEAPAAVSIALSASAAMCLPISTPPNAIVYGSGRIETHDLLLGGMLIGLVAPPLVVLWSTWLL